MKNLKKLLAILVVVAVMTTSMLSAFAAAPADVVGTDYEGAVSRLVALGVLTGRPDGTFAPNDSISRSEFAAVIVRALGYDAVAATAKGVTKFSDVSASYWASGYINLATTLGIIKGKPDGTFAPNDKVLLEEAVTMIVRALGMDAFAVAKGGYPAGYLVVGNDVGFTKDVKAVAGFAATRGIVAQLVDNAKDNDIYVQDGFGDSQTYKKADPRQSFLTKLGMTPVENVIVTKTPGVSDLDENEFTAGGNSYEAKDGAFDVEALLGKKVTLWYDRNDDNKVVLAEVKTKASETITVTKIEAITYNADSDVTKIKVKKADGETSTYDVVKESKAVWNLGTSDIDTLLSKVVAAGTSQTKTSMTLSKDAYKLTLTLSGGKVAFASGLTFKDAERLKNTPVINDVKDLVKFTGPIYEFKNGDDEVARLEVVKNGVAATIKDIKRHDIIMVAENLGGSGITDDRYYIIATDKTVKGTLNSAAPSKADPDSVKVDGTSYDMSAFAKADPLNGIAIGNKVTLRLDSYGRVVEVAKEAAVSADKYAVVLGAEKTTSFGTGTYKVKLLLPTKDKVIYTVDADGSNVSWITDILDADADGTAAEDILVRYHVNSDGDIDVIAETEDVLPGSNVKVDMTRGKIGSEIVADSIVVFNNNSGTIEVLDWNSLKDNDSVTVESWILDDDDQVAAVMFTGATFSASGKYAYVTSRTELKDNKFELSAFTKDGEVSLKTIASAVYGTKGNAITYSINAKGEITPAAFATAKAKTGDIASVSSSRVKIGSDYFYFTDDTVILYDSKGDGDDVETLNKADLYSDMEVEVYLTNGAGSDDIAILVVTKM